MISKQVLRKNINCAVKIVKKKSETMKKKNVLKFEKGKGKEISINQFQGSPHSNMLISNS
jgi:hypothetical protein